jgi:acetylornithine/N-succinyldiaminopimelate aminotransferase
MSHLLPVYARSDYSFEKGEGSYLYDRDGNKFLDFAAGIAVNSVGHCHPHVVKALKGQADKLWHVSNLYHISHAEELAERIAKASKFAHYVFFCNSGAEAVECGIKMIRRYFFEKGQPKKNRIITFEGGFHGRTIATISAAKKDKLTKGYYPLLDGFDQVPFNDIEAVKNMISDETAGILIEPVQGEGGIRVCPDQFLKDLRKICDDNNLLLFFDGVQCGMGRTGKFFSHEWADVYPDITSSAKGIGGGFPLGACLATKEVGDVMTPGTHGSTYAGGPLAIAVCSAVMDILLEDGFFEKSCSVGEYLKDELNSLQKQFPDYISEVRGRGMMIGVKMNEGKIPDVGKLIDNLRHKGLLTVPAAENVMRLLPPLTLSKDEAKQGIDIIKNYFSEMLEK